jgi:uracil-DNA glycosylase family 4
MTLELLEAQAKACTACRLAEGRTQVVFGEGNPNAHLMFVGEGPGEEEDKTGRPFVGKAGQLLDRILQAAGIPREERLHHQHRQVPPPGKPRPPSR